jgi:hypothetical protein
LGNKTVHKNLQEFTAFVDQQAIIKTLEKWLAKPPYSAPALLENGDDP